MYEVIVNVIPLLYTVIMRLSDTLLLLFIQIEKKTNDRKQLTRGRP